MNPMPEQNHASSGERSAARPRWQRPQRYRRARTSPAGGTASWAFESQPTPTLGAQHGSAGS